MNTPNYLTDNMRPDEYEPACYFRRIVHNRLVNYITQLAGYFDGQGLTLIASHIRHEILAPCQSLDYHTALAGLDAFRNRYDNFGFYQEHLDGLEVNLDDMARRDMSYWFPEGIDD